ncbi:Imm3 family immunity protein [Lysinibacillus sp. FJAT-14745]|uniref:Imm3 family immunity protein n=1 Tax=Lysinibacillus sp. FJAT-14745 TaxID=1704289 RepID=UPI002101A48D|nr:Imm3 family immunity protein [Lysinibacillus sp. FJAT-14745]
MYRGREALARNFYDYDMLAKKSETDKAIIFVIFSEIAVSHVKILHSFKDYLEKNLTELDFKIIQQENKLTPQQYSDLASRKERVLQKLINMSLDYFPRACWYYDELVEGVQKFINNFKLENENTDSIVTTVLQRFDRDCENTKVKNSLSIQHLLKICITKD